MLIGLIEFERTKGARDKSKRKKRTIATATGMGIGTGTAIVAKGLDEASTLADIRNYSDIGQYKGTDLDQNRRLSRDLLKRRVEQVGNNLSKKSRYLKSLAVPLTYYTDGFVPGIKKAVRSPRYLLGSAIVGGLYGNYLARKGEK